MPEYYAGVCSYKGNIIPVIKLHSEGGSREDSLLLAVSCGKYQLGILLREILISCHLPEPLKRWKALRIWAIRVSGRERKSAGMKKEILCNRYGENSGGPDNLPVRKSRKV